MSAVDAQRGAALFLLRLLVVLTIAGLGVGVYFGMSRRDRPQPPPRPVSYCDHGLRIWPGTAAFPTADCAQR